MLDPTYCGLPLVCKVGTSKKGDFQRILLLLVVGDALDFGKYFRFILQGSGDGSGKLDFGFSPHARRICRNASCSGGGSLSCKEVRYPASPPSPPSPPPQKNKIKSLVPYMHFHSFTQRAKNPTTNQGSLIDHIYTRNISVQLHVEVSPQKYNYTISAQC